MLEKNTLRYAWRMKEILIREAREEDVAEILMLYRDAELGAENEFTVERARAQLAVFRRYPNYRIFVAVADGRAVGTYEGGQVHWTCELSNQHPAQPSCS